MKGHNYIYLSAVDDNYSKKSEDIESLYERVWFMHPFSVRGDSQKYYIRFDDDDAGDQAMMETLNLCLNRKWRKYRPEQFKWRSRSR